MAWTKEMVEQLQKMWSEGLTANEIAKKIGVSKNSIVGKVHRLCLKARPSPIKKKEDNVESIDVSQSEMIDDIQVESSVAEEKLETKAPVAASERKKTTRTEIKLVELDSHTCRWPIGDPRDDDFCFCGKKVRTGQTYCDEHSAMAYVKALHK